MEDRGTIGFQTGKHMLRVDDVVHVARTAALLLVFWIVITDEFGGTKRLLAYLALFGMVFLLYVGSIAKREWAQLAPMVALVISGVVTSRLSPALGVDTYVNWLVVLLLLTHWAPVPPIEQAGRQLFTLMLVAAIPVAMSLTMLLPWMGPSPWQIALGERFTFGQAGPPAAALLLVAVMGAQALVDRGHGWARWLQVVSLVFLTLTSSRLYTGVVLAFGLAVVWRSWRGGALATTRARVAAVAPWAMVVVLGVLRGVPRSVGTGRGDAVAGISTSGRTEFWRAYLREGRDFLLTGGGIGRTDLMAKQGVADGWDPHTDYLFALLDVGVLGLVLFVGALVFAYRRRLLWLSEQDRMVYGIVVLMLPVIALLEPAFRTLGFMLPLSVLLAAMADRKEHAVASR